VAAGLPDGAIRPPPRGALDGARLRAALEELAGAGRSLDHREQELLRAWLRAFKHHWPERFAAVLGDAGERALGRLGDGAGDANRYLKLRRIAVENLSHLL
jgi:hypothetical protein